MKYVFNLNPTDRGSVEFFDISSNIGFAFDNEPFAILIKASNLLSSPLLKVDEPDVSWYEADAKNIEAGPWPRILPKPAVILLKDLPV